MSLSRNKSVTLFELLIAIAILGLIVLGVSNLELFSRYQVASSDRRAKLQNDASYALEHMAKYIGQAIGNFNDSAIAAYADNQGIRIRIDNNPANGRIDAGDAWIAYRHENIGTSDSEIRFYRNAGTGENPAGSYERITNQVAITNSADPPEKWGLSMDISDNNVNIQIICRWYPSQAASIDNPEVTMKNSIKMPAVSIN